MAQLSHDRKRQQEEYSRDESHQQNGYEQPRGPQFQQPSENIDSTSDKFDWNNTSQPHSSGSDHKEEDGAREVNGPDYLKDLEGPIGRDAPSSQVGYGGSGGTGRKNRVGSENTGYTNPLAVPTQHGTLDNSEVRNVGGADRASGTGYGGVSSQESSHVGSQVRNGVPHGVLSENAPSGAVGGLCSGRQNPVGNIEEHHSQQTGVPSGADRSNDGQNPIENIEDYRYHQTGYPRSTSKDTPYSEQYTHPNADGSRDQAAVSQDEVCSGNTEGGTAVDHNHKRGFLTKLKDKLPSRKQGGGGKPVNSEQDLATAEDVETNLSPVNKPSLATKVKDKLTQKDEINPEIFQ